MASVPRSFGMCFINDAFQNASAQCALKAAIPTRGPLYSNAGMPHLDVLANVRTGGVDSLADPFEDRLGERLRLGDIRVDAPIPLWPGGFAPPDSPTSSLARHIRQ